jgi:formate dehydrogenase subunit gamma
MTRPPEGELLRFSRAVRWVHGLAGGLVLVLIISAAVLYNSELQVLVGHRPVVEAVHVWTGFALPLPVLAGLAFRSVRADAAELDRFTARDWQWLRSRTRRDGSIPVGKFNAGQKLNGSLSTGGCAVLLMTGAVMYLTDLTPLAWRTGATLVHDWTALALGLLVVGHLYHALRDPLAMRGIRTGSVPLRWALHDHPAWVEQLLGPLTDDDQRSRR